MTGEVVDRYTEAMSFPFAGVAAAEYHRWFYRCRLTPTGLRYLQRVKSPIELPVLHLHGSADPTSLPTMAAECERHVSGPLTVRTVPGVGAFVPEEAPEDTTRELIDWLAVVHPSA